MPHASDSTWYGCLTVWLASRSLIVSRSTHVAANAFPSFLFMAESHSFASMDHIFIHASVDGHWGGFLVLALVQSAATHNGVHGSFRAMVFSGEMTGVGFLDQMLILVWVFWGLSLLCSTVLYKLTFPPLVSQGSLCSTPSPHFLFADVCMMDTLAAVRGQLTELLLCVSLIVIWSPFHVLVGHLYILFGELSVDRSTHFLLGLLRVFCFFVCLFWYWATGGVYKFRTWIPCQSLHWQVCSPILWVAFLSWLGLPLLGRNIYASLGPIFYFCLYCHSSRRWIWADIAVVHVREGVAYVFL